MLTKQLYGKPVLLGTFAPKITQFRPIEYKIDIFWKKFKISESRYKNAQFRILWYETRQYVVSLFYGDFVMFGRLLKNVSSHIEGFHTHLEL
jgi:hypothetical protein